MSVNHPMPGFSPTSAARIGSRSRRCNASVNGLNLVLLNAARSTKMQLENGARLDNQNFMPSDWSILLIQLILWGPRIKSGKYGKGSLSANNGFSLLLPAK